MLIRLGYACISETLPHVTSSSPYTYTAYLKEQDNIKLDRIIVSNFLDLEKIIIYNIKNNIHFYRMSSNMIPLATKKEVSFDYITKYKDYYIRIAKLIKASNMRVDFHPSEYCVLNSINKEVVKNSIIELKYHYKLLKSFKIKDKLLVLHVGSAAFGKEKSMQRFINNFQKLPKYLQRIIAIENDDKIFTVADCLKIAHILNISVILDYHHHICNKSNFKIEEVLATWTKIKPKMHFSSPKNKTKKEYRSHNDYIESTEFIKFLENLKYLNKDIDIMLEAKKKDEALFRLTRELRYKTDYEFIDETSFII